MEIDSELEMPEFFLLLIAVPVVLFSIDTVFHLTCYLSQLTKCPNTLVMLCHLFAEIGKFQHHKQGEVPVLCLSPF